MVTGIGTAATLAAVAVAVELLNGLSAILLAGKIADKPQSLWSRPTTTPGVEMFTENLVVKTRDSLIEMHKVAFAKMLSLRQLTASAKEAQKAAEVNEEELWVALCSLNVILPEDRRVQIPRPVDPDNIDY